MRRFPARPHPQISLRRRRIRHSAAGLPTPPVSGAWAWYRADYVNGLSGLPAPDSTITNWSDISGNDRHGTAAAGDEPTFRSNIQNGLPAIEFVAASTQFFTTGAPLAQPATVLAVIKPDDTAAGKAIVYSSGGVNALIYISNTENATLYGGASINEDVVSTAAFTVIAGIWNGASSLIYDGTDGTATTGNAGANGVVNVNIGGDGSGGFAFDGHIGEIILYSSALSNTDINTIGTAMKTRWNATWTDLS